MSSGFYKEVYLQQKLGIVSRMIGCFKHSPLFGIVLHKGCNEKFALSYLNGKKNIIAYSLQSSLLEILSPDSKNELENAKANNPRSYDVMLKSYLKKYIRSLRKIHKNLNKIIFIDDNPELLRFVGIKKKHLLRLIPAPPILDDIYNSDKHTKEEIEEYRQSREIVLSSTEYLKMEYAVDSEMIKNLSIFLCLGEK